MKSLRFGVAVLLVPVAGVLTLAVGAGAQSASRMANILKGYVPASDFLLERYEGGKEHLIKVAEAMPEANYGFQPTPEMEPFGVRIAHIARMNFTSCSSLVGKPEPRKGESLGKTVTGKAALIEVMKESFAFCDGYMSRLSPQVLVETVSTEGPPVMQGRTVKVELGGPAIDIVAHNHEMYGYLAVYLRLKGITPPTSGPARKGGYLLPTMTIGLVGVADPPVGSMVTPKASGIGAPGAIVDVTDAAPCAFGVNVPAPVATVPVIAHN